MAPADKPQAVVEDQPFSRERWTHVALTFAGFNQGGEEGVARLYIDGELQGEVSGRSQTHTWDRAKAFDRALAAAEVKALNALPAGVAGLHAR